MNYASMRKYDTSNWSGINATIFFSGCHFNCPGCFNTEAQDFNYGFEFTKKEQDLFIKWAKAEHVTGICILGGEPFQQNLYTLGQFIFRLKKMVGKPIHMWTGYRFEELTAMNDTLVILKMIDTLVDGRFIESKKDLNLRFRGSSNQRVIDVKRTLAEGALVYV